MADRWSTDGSGRSGLQVSVLSFGSWVSFGAQLDTDEALELPRRRVRGAA